MSESDTSPQLVVDDAVDALRSLILAGERYRAAIALAAGVGTTESQAISYLALHGDTGQSSLGRDLNLTSSAATALVDRLEKQAVAERTRHPHDRRRTIIRLSERGRKIAFESARNLRSSLETVDVEDLAHWSTGLWAISHSLRAIAKALDSGELDWESPKALPAA